ncbi:MAG: SusC/RagA family TonB-linked outer membrane protein [Cyclobacteriaceae bacterium]|jgi:TonB-linked SusC/RagA family outer membrane protein|nr:SusC/RagA family TonB-linked outer membrane protein [Cytophagales bacterium]MCZ8329145.1 SusC/RagA family TonB-linked outer membrane protein [Cyclobacteriaceae bacterium]
MKKFLLLCSAVLLLHTYALAQERTVSGRVTSTEDGSALPGVNVVVKGTTNGTVTDADGNYKLSVPSAQSALVFSFIGLKTSEVVVGERTVVDVSLALDVTQLSEVVVTGVGAATDKRKIGISVESISGSKLPQAPTASIDQALVGKIPGAQISSVDGTPGAATNILLRGINSIQGGTNPMILVDGVQVKATDLNSLDLSNIERVEVVQGAASATIYGAQGANGVIQLFTKRGKSGKVSIDFSTSFGVSEYINAGNLGKADKHGFATNSNGDVIDAGGNVLTINPDGSYYDIDPVWPRAILDPAIRVEKPYNRNLRYYDHFDQIFRSAKSTIHNLSVSGGTEKSDYSFSFSNTRQESTIKRNNGIERTNFSANIGAEIFRNFKVRSTTQLIYTYNNMNPFYQAGRNSIYEMLNVSPFYDLNRKNEDGNYPFYLGTNTVSVNGYNPNYYFDYAFTKDKKFDVVQNLQLNYQVNKFIELDVKYGLNVQQQDVRWVVKNQVLAPNLNYDFFGEIPIINNDTDATGEVSDYKYTRVYQNLLSTATIRTDFREDFGMSLPLKTVTQISYDYREDDFSDFATYGYSLKTSSQFNSENVASTQVLRDRRTPFITFGYLVNQKFEYSDFLGASVGFRTDYSSAFGAGQKPATFPRADSYVRLSALNFWKGSDFLSNKLSEFKIRAAYGEAGIQPGPFDRYQTLEGATIGSNLTYYFPASQNNPNLVVEKTKEFEVGTDFNVNIRQGEWLSGLTANFTYWTRESKDVIFNVDIASSTGSGSILDNAFSLGSNGVQLGLNLDVLQNKDFNWDFTFNVGRQRSRIKDIVGPNEIVLTASAGSTNLVLKEGALIGQIYGYKAIRSLDATRLDGTRYIPESEVGDYTISSEGYVVDKATKRILFENEAKSFGDPNPDFNASFINNISYKDFLTFSFQFDWVYGSKLYNQTKEWMYRDGIHKDYARPVTIDGETAAFAGYYQSAYSDYFGSINGARNSTKDYFYEDASFLRLRNISIGFDLARVVELKYFKRAQIVFTGRNLLTFTKYTGFDPEVNSVVVAANNGNNRNVGSAFERGIDHNSVPNNKTYQVSLNLSF